MAGELDEIIVHAAGQPAVAQFVTDRLGLSPDVTDDSQFDYDDSQRRILAHFGKDTLEDLGLENQYPAVRALGCALSYLQATQMTGLERLTNLDVYSDVQFMRLDVTARRLREKIEDDPSAPKYILTVWGMGYKWSADGAKA